MDLVNQSCGKGKNKLHSLEDYVNI